MKTFKRFLLLLAATVLTSTVRAQVINCDLNYNGVLDIEDITMLIDGYLTGDTSLVNTDVNIDPFTVMNSLIVGTWYKSPTESITFREDGTTNYMAGCTYKYMPWQGYIQFYNSDGFPVHAVRVTEVTSDYLAILPTGSDDPILYTAVSISLSQTTLELKPNEIVRLTAKVLPSSASPVVWSSSNNRVATVENGFVTGIADGTATITAEVARAKATCTVKVVSKVPVTKITLSSTSLSLTVGGGNGNLAAVVSPSNATDKSLTWVSSQPSVATVSNDGIVTPVSGGTTTITAMANDGSGVKASCNVTVTEPVSSITLSSSTLSLFVGKATQLTATVSPSTATDKSLTWSTSNSSIATVSAEGVVKAVGEGKATITATAKDGSGIKASCTVTVTVPVSTISLSSNSLALFVGKSSQLTATVSPTTATNQSLTWSTSNTNIATVSADGIVKAVGEGKAIITATAKDGSGVKASCNVTVTVPVSSITLSSNSLSLDVGKTSQLTATVSPSTATNKSITWSTSNSSVATVSTDGTVKAVADGTATIMAIANDGSGVKAICDVNVTVWVDLGLSVKWATRNIGANSPEDYGDYFAWGETTSKGTYNWSTYNWCKGSEYTMTKYCTSSDYGTVDNKSVLDPEDDAAHVNWGGTWRMPTDDELKELKTKCTLTMTIQNGVDGCLVTGPNGNSIFLPVAGYRYYGSLYHAGSYGHYWSSSLYADNPTYGWDLYFYSSINFYVDYGFRYSGRSVRAVCP